MAGKNETENVVAEQPKKKKKGLKIIIIIVLIIVLLAGGFTAFAFFTKSFFFAPKEEGAKTTVDIKETMYPLETFIVNLEADSTKRYLKVSVVIGCINKKDVELIMEKEMQIRDGIISTLRNQGLERLGQVENEENVKQALKEAVNKLFDPDLDISIYFTEYIIQ